MAGDAVGDGKRYWAFISYSHKDAAFGRRLHRKLESYVLPRRLTGADKLPRRLVPIFRDREELAAANDLSTEVRAALAQSRSLIVVCSPHAAASQWVGREVALFQELHPGRPVLAAIRDGEPADSFPKPLHRVGADGTLVEPLAADFRRGRDGEALGLLKLVAGMAGVGLDALVQRDAQRNFRRVTAVTAMAIAAMLVMAGLTGYALHARSEAERQRAEAEGLDGFMHTDLREKLRGVGRLDIMTVVNDRALRYYDDQGPEASLPPETRARRARVLQAQGEDDETRGDLRGASAKFGEAAKITADLLAADPRNPERIFDEAQSRYWTGKIAFDVGRSGAAETEFRRYQALAYALLAIAPHDPRYLREASFAEGDLCTVALKPPVRPDAALALCTAALDHMSAAARGFGGQKDLSDELVNRHAWLADSFAARGDFAHARAERLVEQTILEHKLVADPKNMDRQQDWVALQLALAVLEYRMKTYEASKTRLLKAEAVIDNMVAFDPSNQAWAQQRVFIAHGLQVVNAKLN